VALLRPTALHALAIFLAFLLLSLVAGELLYLWLGAAAPYILAALKRDRYSLAASALALLYMALHGGYSNVWGDDFMAPLELAAIGMAALEVRKPLGAVAYAYAVAITLLPTPSTATFS
jgi:hypothetical protein